MNATIDRFAEPKRQRTRYMADHGFFKTDEIADTYEALGSDLPRWNTSISWSGSPRWRRIAVLRWRMALSHASRLVFAAALALAASTSAATEVRVDGWCISYDASAILVSGGQGRPGLPTFFVPFDDESMDRLPAAGGTGFRATYEPKRPGTRERLVAGPDASGRKPDKSSWTGCPKIRVDHGLSQFQPGLAGRCAGRSIQFYDWYLPSELTEETGAVRIRCGKDERMVRCQMTDVLPNGWGVSLAIPKTSLGRWPEVAQQYSRYFEDHLASCMK